jgi:hypothetical protein
MINNEMTTISTTPNNNTKQQLLFPSIFYYIIIILFSILYKDSTNILYPKQYKVGDPLTINILKLFPFEEDTNALSSLLPAVCDLTTSPGFVIKMMENQQCSIACTSWIHTLQDKMKLIESIKKRQYFGHWFLEKDFPASFLLPSSGSRNEIPLILVENNNQPQYQRVNGKIEFVNVSLDSIDNNIHLLLHGAWSAGLRAFVEGADEDYYFIFNHVTFLILVSKDALNNETFNIVDFGIILNSIQHIRKNITTTTTKQTLKTCPYQNNINNNDDQDNIPFLSSLSIGSETWGLQPLPAEIIWTFDVQFKELDIDNYDNKMIFNNNLFFTTKKMYEQDSFIGSFFMFVRHLFIQTICISVVSLHYTYM